MEAMARGILEAVTEEHQAARIGQVRYLGENLERAGVPIVKPIGSHAIFIDARRFLPHVDQDEYPAQALAAELFIESGIRTMERGNVSAGRDPVTGKNRHPVSGTLRTNFRRHRCLSFDFSRPDQLLDISRNKTLRGGNIVAAIKVAHRKLVFPMKNFVLMAEVNTKQTRII